MIYNTKQTNHAQIKKHTACLTPTLAFPVHIHLQIHTGILKVVNTVESLRRKKKNPNIPLAFRETILISELMDNVYKAVIHLHSTY